MREDDAYRRMLRRRYPELTEEQAHIRAQADYDALKAGHRTAWISAVFKPEDHVGIHPILPKFGPLVEHSLKPEGSVTPDPE